MALSRQSFCKTLSLIKSDMQYRCDYEHKQLTAVRILSFLTNHAVVSQIIIRFQIFFETHYMGLIASILKGINSIIFTVNVDSSANIDEGLLFLHPNYITIGKNVTIGKRCIFAQQNVVAPSYIYETDAMISNQGPVIGDDVLLGVGAVLLGNISIGNFSKASVNAAVDKSFPEGSILVGVPAKNRALS